MHLFSYAYLGIAAIVMASAPSPAFAQQEKNAQYAACTRSVATQPEEAYKQARAWYGKSQSLASQHCMALALFALKNYSEAAVALDSILARVPASQEAVWLNMKIQAARAHFAAGNVKAAEAHADEALLWAVDKDVEKETVPLLALRAQLYAKRGENLRAVQDLDHALEIASAPELLLQRAELFLKMDMAQPARQDIEQVLAQDAQNKKALSLLALTAVN